MPQCGFVEKAPFWARTMLVQFLALPLTVSDLGEVKLMYQDAFRNHPETCWNHQEIYYLTTNPEGRAGSVVGQFCSSGSEHLSALSWTPCWHLLLFWPLPQASSHPYVRIFRGSQKPLHRCGLSSLSVWLGISAHIWTSKRGWRSPKEKKRGVDVGYTTNSSLTPKSPFSLL